MITEMPLKDDCVFALTSLSPSPARAVVQNQCIQSWHKAGLQVRSFNDPSEFSSLRSFPGVEFISVTGSQTAQGASDARHFAPIKTMLKWAAAQDAPVLIINSDIEIRLLPWQLTRARWLSDGGLCYFVRYNHDGEIARAQREPYGIDAFMLHGRQAALFPESSLSMGQPFWDYWLPHTAAENHQPIFSLDSAVAFHRNHPQQWSWENWHLCALEFDRMTGILKGERTFEACVAMAARVRQQFDSKKIILPSQPIEIRKWVQQTFSGGAPKTFLELGAHTGTDTVWMSKLPGVTIHAFEPDPRNCSQPLPNVILHRAAIADRDGSAPFILSKSGWGQTWTHSSSIKLPKNHLKRYPVTFGDLIEVPAITLDSYSRQNNLGVIDFIWADIQGAEAEMIRGGRQTLARTRYLYTEYSDDELYENQATLADIVQSLPEFRIVELWSDDVLLENRLLSGEGRRTLS
jgi:FkbM family methyltransferase